LATANLPLPGRGENEGAYRLSRDIAAGGDAARLLTGYLLIEYLAMLETQAPPAQTVGYRDPEVAFTVRQLHAGRNDALHAALKQALGPTAPDPAGFLFRAAKSIADSGVPDIEALLARWGLAVATDPGGRYRRTHRLP